MCVLRNEYEDKDYKYIYSYLNNLFNDKVFRFSSRHRVIGEFSPKLEVILTMNKVYNEHYGTEFTVFKNNRSFATYEEMESLDIDDLVNDSDIKERIGNRESGSKSLDENVRYTVNELINREKRFYDYIMKEVMPLFSARTYRERKENYE